MCEYGLPSDAKYSNLTVTERAVFCTAVARRLSASVAVVREVDVGSIALISDTGEVVVRAAPGTVSYPMTLPPEPGCAGQVLTRVGSCGGTAWCFPGEERPHRRSPTHLQWGFTGFNRPVLITPAGPLPQQGRVAVVGFGYEEEGAMAVDIPQADTPSPFAVLAFVAARAGVISDLHVAYTFITSTGPSAESFRLRATLFKARASAPHEFRPTDVSIVIDAQPFGSSIDSVSDADRHRRLPVERGDSVMLIVDLIPSTDAGFSSTATVQCNFAAGALFL